MFSDPVVGNKFFGRDQVLNLLAKRIDGLKDGYRQNIAIIGPKMIGKSSLILHAFSNFNQTGILPIYIDLTPKSFSHFIHKFLGALLYHYLKHNNLQTCEDLDTLKKDAEKNIPKTVAAIRAIEKNFQNLQFNQAYEGLLVLTAVLKKESGFSCIVILDEFHLLNTYKIKHPFLSLAKEIMMQKDTMYILTSSQVSYAKKILASELSLLFGNFEIVRLKPFNYSTCCKFLEKRFQDINLPQNFRDFLISFSEGHPFYLDILSNEIKEKTRELNQQEVSPSLISEALNVLVYDSKGILNQYFTNLLNHSLNGADYSSFLPVLLSASEKGSCLKDISKASNRQAKVTAKLIGQLLDKDLFSKVGAFYRIQDKIFRFWLKSVYHRKSLSLIADPSVESKEFSKEIREQILRFSDETKKGLSQRVAELFKCFNNEIVMIQNKFSRFWQFEEIWPLPQSELPDCIIARYKGGHWACLIKEQQVNETEIQEFFHYCQLTKYKVRRAIVVALKELELNARLLALEKKMWIWHPSDLNLLFDLYGKEQIII